MKKILSFLVTLVALAAIVFLANKYMDGKRAQQEQARAAAEVNSKIQTLDVERQQKRKELDQLRRDAPEADVNFGSLQLVFLSLDAQLFDTVFPVMQEYDIPGIMVLSPVEMPGSWGKITESQYKQMIASGWSAALRYTGEMAWPNNVVAQLNQKGLDVPNVAYFEEGRYTMELDATLESSGIRYAIHHGEDALPIMTTSFPEEGIVHLGAKGWNYTNLRDDVTSMITKGGNYALTVTFTGDDAFKLQAFRNVLDFLMYPMWYDSTLNVGSPDEAVAVRKNHTAQAIKTKEEWEQSIATLESEIESLSTQIDEINKAYKESKK